MEKYPKAIMASKFFMKRLLFAVNKTLLALSTSLFSAFGMK
jgi:hypothetical protein